MSKLLEVFGRAVTVHVADLIWEWLNCVKTGTIRHGFEKDFDDILEHLSRMELAEANSKLQFYLFENPACSAGRMAAAAICLHQNQLPEAIEQLNSIYMREPTNTLALYALGNCYERLGQEAQAMEFYQDALKFKNYLTLPHQRLAAMYLKNGRLDRAIAEYEQLRNENPDDVGSLVLLGHLYMANLQYQEATEAFDKAILIHPDNFHVDENDDVDLLLQIGETEQAAERVKWLLEKDNDRVDLHLKLADILCSMEQDTEAAVHLEHALRVEPNCLEARVRYGMCLMQSGYKAGAAKEFAKALDINDDIIDAYLGLAAAQKMSDKTQDSYRTLSLAASIAPNSVLLFSHIAALQTRSSENNSECGSVAFAEGEPQEDQEKIMHGLLKEYLRQLNCQPNNADAHYKLGLLLLNNANLAAAMRHFEGALAINPTHYRAMGKLAICLNETGQRTKAIKLLTSTTLPDGDTLALHYKTAMLFADRKQFTKTANELQTLLGQNFAHAAAGQNLSVVLQNLGLIDRASAAWDCLDSSGEAENRE